MSGLPPKKASDISKERGGLRSVRDQLIARCPLRICAAPNITMEEWVQTKSSCRDGIITFGFIVDALRPDETTKLKAVTDRFSALDGTVIENEDGQKELRYELKGVGEMQAFILDLEAHPKFSPPSLQKLPDEAAVAKIWNTPGKVFHFEDHLAVRGAVRHGVG